MGCAALADTGTAQACLQSKFFVSNI